MWKLFFPKHWLWFVPCHLIRPLHSKLHIQCVRCGQPQHLKHRVYFSTWYILRTDCFKCPNLWRKAGILIFLPSQTEIIVCCQVSSERWAQSTGQTSFAVISLWVMHFWLYIRRQNLNIPWYFTAVLTNQIKHVNPFYSVVHQFYVPIYSPYILNLMIPNTGSSEYAVLRDISWLSLTS